MKKKHFVGALLASLLASSALAFEPFVVRDIRVEGIQRTEAGTVFSYLPVKVGDTFTENMASQAVKTLFGTGFFKDVRLEMEGDVLVVLLEERPAIAVLDFSGLKAYKKEDLLKGLKEVGLAESRIFDRALVERAEQELKRQYLSNGYYAVQISSTITPLERNRVAINFSVVEGDIARIKQINIIGASAFAEKDLLKELKLTSSNWITWYTKDDQYSKQKLTGDLDTIRSYYMDRGYLEFNVESTQVSISPDKQDIYISIAITEGEKYSVSAVKLAGTFVVPEDQLKGLVRVFPGDVYSREKMTDTTKAISDRLANDGYANANVNAAPEIDKEAKTAAFTIFVDPGSRSHVRRITVAGNTRTRDEVIRREIRQMEAAWYDSSKITLSKTRLERLGYFDEVTTETPPVPGVNDQVDVNFKVKEKPTGSMMIGAGYSTAEKFTVSGSVSQANLFGSGKTVGVGLNTSKINTNLFFSYMDPYHTVDGIARGFDVYHRKSDTSSLAIATYGTRSTGGGVRYGLPLSEHDYLSFGAAIDTTAFTVYATTPLVWQNYLAANGTNTHSLIGTSSWTRSTVDSALYPMSGANTTVGGELNLPGSTYRFVRVSAIHSRYIPFTKSQTLNLRADIGIGAGYGGKGLPFNKNYYAGGIGSVRGFETSSLGPYDATTGGRLGGTKKIVGTAEYLFPVPGMEKEKSVRLGVFTDVGQVWASGQKIRLGDMRYSAGLSVFWSSPFGPLKFAIANPLNKKDGDKVQRMAFTMGTTF